MTNPMNIGLVAQGYNEMVADVSACVDFARCDIQQVSGTRFAQLHAANVKTIVMVPSGSGGYPGSTSSGGILNLDPTTFANYALGWFQANTTPTHSPWLEVLNEPYGNWFWGPNCLAQSHADQYARILQACYNAFHTAYGAAMPGLLASYERSDWGPLWKASTAVSNVMQYVTGVTVHPYGGSDGSAGGANGNRSRVTFCNTSSGKPVFITELGWPTATSANGGNGISTSDSQQWSESAQATNISNMCDWCASQSYVSLFTYFAYRDFGANGNGSLNWYGVTRTSGETNGASASRKPGFFTLQSKAAQLSTPIPLITSPSMTAPGGTTYPWSVNPFPTNYRSPDPANPWVQLEAWDQNNVVIGTWTTRQNLPPLGGSVPIAVDNQGNIQNIPLTTDRINLEVSTDSSGTSPATSTVAPTRGTNFAVGLIGAAPGGTSISIPQPTDTAEGKMIIASIFSKATAPGSAALTSFPAGFVEIGHRDFQNASATANVRLTILAKQATAAEPASYSFICGNSTPQAFIGKMWVTDGVSNLRATFQTNASGTTFAFPSTARVLTGDLVYGIAAFTNGEPNYTYSGLTSYTATPSGATSSDQSIAVGFKAIVADGTLGATSITSSNTNATGSDTSAVCVLVCSPGDMLPPFPATIFESPDTTRPYVRIRAKDSGAVVLNSGINSGWSDPRQFLPKLAAAPTIIQLGGDGTITNIPTGTQRIHVELADDVLGTNVAYPGHSPGGDMIAGDSAFRSTPPPIRPSPTCAYRPSVRPRFCSMGQTSSMARATLAGHSRGSSCPSSARSSSTGRATFPASPTTPPTCWPSSRARPEAHSSPATPTASSTSARSPPPRPQPQSSAVRPRTATRARRC
jgi:hypothetical protein